jgi:hypothetical protein
MGGVAVADGFHLQLALPVGASIHTMVTCLAASWRSVVAFRTS